MRINNLFEYTTPSSQPNQAGGQAPTFGRDPNVLEDDKLDETTAGASSSGSFPGEAGTVGNVQRRGKGSMFQGIKTSKKFVNSPVTEDEISEEQLLAKQQRKELFNRAKNKDLGNRPSDREIIAKEAQDLPDWMKDIKAIAHKMAPQDKLRQRQQERDAQQKAEQQQRLQQDIENLPNLIAKYKAMEAEYKSLGGSNWQYADREQNLSDEERRARDMEYSLRNLRNRIHKAKQASQGVAEGSDKLQGTPVVSLSDFGDKDYKKDRYGRPVPKKLKKDDPRVKFHKEPKQQGVAEVSDQTLISYLTKVDADSQKHKADPTKRSPKKASKSIAGFSRAFNKLDSRKEQGVTEGSLNEFAPDNSDSGDEDVLRKLAAQWWNGTEQQMAKAQRTLEMLGWEIGPDESGDDDAGVYVYRIGDHDGRDTISFRHSELELDEGVAEGKGDFAQAIGNLHGWYEETSNNPNLRIWDFDDDEGGYYAQGEVIYNTQTGRVKVKFEDSSGQYGDDIDQTFNSIGDAMNALRTLTTQYRYNTGKAQNFDRLGQREPVGPDSLRKTDRTGRKGTLAGGPTNNLKYSIQHNKGRHGPKGVLPEQGVAEGAGRSFLERVDDFLVDYSGSQSGNSYTWTNGKKVIEVEIDPSDSGTVYWALGIAGKTRKPNWVESGSDNPKDALRIVKSFAKNPLPEGVAEGSSAAKYKVKSIGTDKKGDYYVSPKSGRKVYKKGVSVGDHEVPDTGEIKKKVVGEESKGLWANIHAKRERIKHGSGEHMRKPGSKGAPTQDAFRKSAK